MQPCEVIVLEVLPSLRGELARKLVKLGLSQQKVSKILELTPAAVSQYVSGKRGQKIEFTPKIQEKINKRAKEIKEDGKKESRNSICLICNEIKEDEIFCEIIEEYCQEKPEKCKD